MEQKLIISPAPHIHSNNSIEKCMWHVVIAMMPALIVSIYVFGFAALQTILISVSSCIATEWLIEKTILKRRPRIGNGSAVITGILLAFNLPSVLPWWIIVIGAIVAIGIGKMSFGGLGHNIWNPALVGRVFLLLSFPAAMTTWDSAVNTGVKYADAVTGASSDASTGATLLSVMKSDPSGIELTGIDWWNLLIGNMNGSLGEVGAIAILIGLIYMFVKKVITWHIPISIIATTIIFSWILGYNPLLEVLSGGLLLGAVFMATDYVTSPMTKSAQIIYGIGIAIITIIIRRYGSYPEGVSFAILLMNSFTPLLNKYCKPHRFGERR